MTEHNCGTGTRKSALWGRGSKAGSRGRIGIAVSAIAMLAFPLVGIAAHTAPSGNGTGGSFVDKGLLARATAHPGDKIDVIIQSTGGADAAGTAAKGVGGGLVKKLNVVGGYAAQIPAARLAKLQNVPGLTVTPDAPVKPTGDALYSSDQIWPYESGAANLWPTAKSSGPTLPAIAIVDTGIDATRAADFGSRVVASVNFSSTTPNAVGDGRGHGTFVAGIAAGAAPQYAGAAPTAPLVSVRVFDDQGVAKTSDIITAIQWILDNKAKYNIRVANFSLHSANPSHFVNDPLDKAVEKLWFNGVTVVSAAGNYGVDGAPVRVGFAPGNDPFVITVGAADLGGNVGRGNDSAAPWSAYGYTYDGFSKPEVAAPGRYMVGPIPPNSTLAAAKASNIVAPGYIQLSGTSFAAPVTSAAAAYLLAIHPSWTPDQVKGALMTSAILAPNAAPQSLGVGEVSAARAANVSNPPNPNKVLDSYITNTGSGPTFDADHWESVASSNSAWDAANWVDANWTSANWTSANWVDANWTSANWTAANWVDANWTSANWTAANWVDASYEDAAEGDAASDSSSYAITPADAAEIASDPQFAPSDPSALPFDPAVALATTTTTTAETTTTTVTAPVTTTVNSGDIVPLP
jgi:serine protease AprX